MRKSINVEEMYGIIHFPMREVACSRVLVDLDNLRKGYIVAYCVDTLIPSEVLKNYTEKDLRISVIHENIHNCFAEANPTFHVVQNVWKCLVGNKLVRECGEMMSAFEDQYAFYFLYSQPERFGITRKDLLYHYELNELKEVSFEVYADVSGKMFRGYSLSEVMNDPWYFMRRFTNDYDTFSEIEIGYILMTEKIREIWKRQIDGAWKRLV